MQAKEIVEIVLASLLVLNVLILGIGLSSALRRITALTGKIEAFLAAMQEETTVTLQQAHDTLARAEALALSTDHVVKDQLLPTLEATRALVENVESTTRTVKDSVQGARRVISSVEAASLPAALAGPASRLLGSPAGKTGLIALGAVLGLRAWQQDAAKKA